MKDYAILKISLIFVLVVFMDGFIFKCRLQWPLLERLHQLLALA